MSDLVIYASGEWEYHGGELPLIYGFMGQPLNHHAEQTGFAKAAVMAFYNNRLEKTPMSEEHLKFVISYIRHCIHAPIYLSSQFFPDGNYFEAEIMELRELSMKLATADDINDFIMRAMEIGMDPL
jgi:hypothetical protein